MSLDDYWCMCKCPACDRGAHREGDCHADHASAPGRMEWRVVYEDGGYNTFNTNPNTDGIYALTAFAEECVEGNRPRLMCRINDGAWLPRPEGTDMQDEFPSYVEPDPTRTCPRCGTSWVVEVDEYPDGPHGCAGPCEHQDSGECAAQTAGVGAPEPMDDDAGGVSLAPALVEDVAMGAHSHLEWLKDEQAARCAYGTREGDGRTCDCKYGAHMYDEIGEMTGCPELRMAIWLLTRDGMSDMGHSAEKGAPVIERIDRYSITVNGHRITANPAQEGALRSMDAAAVERFLHALGRITPPFIAAWQAYERASAKAADMYEAIPIAHCRDGSAIPRCDCGTVALSGLCRMCRKEKP